LDLLRVENGALVYRIENQGCSSWGIRVSDLGLADPPVVFDGYPDRRPWRPFLESFSLAAVEMVLYEAIFTGDEGCNDNCELYEADIVRLEELYERLPFPDYPAWWQPEVSQGIRWFGGLDVLLREDSRNWLWVLARNTESLTRVRNALPGDWLMLPD